MFFRLAVEAIDADLQAAQRLLQGLLEVAADGHGLAHRLHAHAEDGVGSRELLKGETRDLHHAIVDTWLEAGGGFLGNIVGQFVEGVTHRKFGGDLGDGETGGLAGEGRATRNARVHFDDGQPPRFGVYAELYVGAAGLDADHTHDANGGVAHFLVFAIGQGLGGGDGDAVAGVDTHGVEVFDRADNHDVVVLVAHDLQLEFLPSQNRFFDEDFGGDAGLESARGDVAQLIHVLSRAAAGAAEGEAGANDDGEADFFGGFFRFLYRVDMDALETLDVGLFHGGLEEVALFSLVDRIDAGPDQFHIVFVEHAIGRHRNRGIERGLAAECGEECIGPFLGDDFLHHFGCNRLDVGSVRDFRIGHDGGRVAIDQHHFVALFAQRLTGLGSGVVEFAGLPDDDGAGTDEHDFL